MSIARQCEIYIFFKCRAFFRTKNLYKKIKPIVENFPKKFNSEKNRKLSFFMKISLCFVCITALLEICYIMKQNMSYVIIHLSHHTTPIFAINSEIVKTTFILLTHFQYQDQRFMPTDTSLNKIMQTCHVHTICTHIGIYIYT